MAWVVSSDGVYRTVWTKESSNKALMEVAKLTEHDLDRIASAVIEATKHTMQERLSWVPDSLKSYYLTAYDAGVIDFLEVLREILLTENE